MIVKDLSLGFLFIVISLFPLGFSSWFVSPKDWWVFPLVVFLISIYNYLFKFGCILAFRGIEVNDH